MRLPTCRARFFPVARWALTAWMITILAPHSRTQVAQNRPSIPRLRPTPSTMLLPKDATSDPAAIAMMQNALAASGGLQAWRALRKAKSQYSSPGPKGKTISVLLLDDWTSSSVRYRRGVRGSNVSPVDHDGHTTFAVGAAGKHPQQVPEFDQARVLADHLPSAAIEVMLRSKSYLFKPINDRQCSVGNVCAKVYRQAIEDGPFLDEQEW